MQLMDVLGHLSFLLTFLSFFQSDLIKLRLWAISAGIIGLIYNGWVHWHMPDGSGIWPVLIWMTIFMCQNITLAVLQIREAIEVRLHPASRNLMCASFATMHSRDWSRLAAARVERRLKPGEALLKAGDSTDCLMLLASGRLEERRLDGRTYLRIPGTIFGELTYMLGPEEYNSSPCTITAIDDDTVVYCWEYRTLKALARTLRFKQALEDGFIRSAGLKHGLLDAGNRTSAPATVPAV